MARAAGGVLDAAAVTDVPGRVARRYCAAMSTPDEPRDQADDDLSQEAVRREKRARLLEEGHDPYPVVVARTHTLAEVRDGWGHLETGEETQDVVGVAGRVMFIRNTGKLCFATLQEGIGTRLQVMLSLAEVGEEALADWKAAVDLGDHVFVEGRVISSRRGELSVMAARWEMASKALRPSTNAPIRSCPARRRHPPQCGCTI